MTRNIRQTPMCDIRNTEQLFPHLLGSHQQCTL